jgi:hypothetical protein
MNADPCGSGSTILVSTCALYNLNTTMEYSTKSRSQRKKLKIGVSERRIENAWLTKNVSGKTVL